MYHYRARLALWLETPCEQLELVKELFSVQWLMFLRGGKTGGVTAKSNRHPAHKSKIQVREVQNQQRKTSMSFRPEAAHPCLVTSDRSSLSVPPDLPGSPKVILCPSIVFYCLHKTNDFITCDQASFPNFQIKIPWCQGPYLSFVVF